ncbi:MAG: four helix bundle protein [Halobacteriovoraceae bacterium]|nr:four helix bundle protein [Halobacteriovoraceae bacterium]
MKNFKTYELALDFYKECQKLKIPNKVIRDQFERASLSIVLNLAEGSGRATEKDRRRFFVIAFGSLRETQCLLNLLNKPDLIAQADNLARYNYSILKSPGCLFS